MRKEKRKMALKSKLGFGMMKLSDWWLVVMSLDR